MAIHRFVVSKIYNNIPGCEGINIVVNKDNLSRRIPVSTNVELGDNLFFNSDNRYLGKCSIDQFTHAFFKANTSFRVRRLVHFTNSNNLRNIKRYGLLSIAELIRRNIPYHNNDDQRLDNYKDGICCTLENPNRRLISAYSYGRVDSEYEVLYINPAILYDLFPDIPKFRIYFDHNAAANQSSSSTFDIEIMFKESLRIETYNRQFNEYLPQYFDRVGKSVFQTTSPQAEVIIFDSIPPKYIFLDEEMTRSIKDEEYE